MKKIVYYCLVFIFIASFLWLARALLLETYPDFSTYYFGAEHILHDQDPYLSDARYYTPLVYPPLTLLFFIPFTIFSYSIAAKIWVGVSLLISFLLIYILARLYKLSSLSTLPIIFGILFFVSFPLKFTLGMGQINLAILLFVLISFYFLYKKADKRAGIFLALPILLKFYPLLLIPYLLYIKKTKVLLWMCIAIIVCLISTVLIASFPTVIGYYTKILSDLITSWKGDYFNQSLSGFLMREISDETLRNILRPIVSLIVIAANAWIIFRKSERSQQRMHLEIASILTLSVLVNSFSWQHHFVLLALPFFIVAHVIYKNTLSKKLFAVLLFSYVLLATNIPHPESFPSILQSHVFIGGMIFWITTLFMLYKYKI